MSIGKVAPILILIATLVVAWSLSADAKNNGRGNKGGKSVERAVPNFERGNRGKSIRLIRKSSGKSARKSRLGNFRFLSRSKSNNSSSNRGRSKSKFHQQGKRDGRSVTMKVIQLGDGENRVGTFLGGTEQRIGSKGVLKSLETENGGQEDKSSYARLASLTDQLDDLPFPIAQLREAAQKGDWEAQFELAKAYENGLVVEKDLGWAARWFGKAAYQGHREGQFRYGRLKLEGLGVPLDKLRAYRWMKLAAEQGHHEAKNISDDLEMRLDIDLLYLERDWVKLFKPSTGVWVRDPPTVEYLQITLERLGYHSGQTDGFAGTRTVAAIEAFQIDQSLEPTGQISEGLVEQVRAKDPGLNVPTDSWKNPDQGFGSYLN